MKAEHYIAGILRQHGVRRLFGIPGGPSIPYLEAFRKKGIEFILTSHEASAAVMADVTARLTGITGVCHATLGPGATNLTTGVGGALLDRSPILALTSEMPDEWLGRTTQMNINHQVLFAPLTKATFRLTAENIAEVMDNSLQIANEEYPGPVHIGLPSDLAGKAVREKPVSTKPGAQQYPDQVSERVKVLLASSRKPLIAAGLTAFRLGAGEMLREFLKSCQVPLVLTPMAKGIIASDHPCYAGVLFHALSDRLVQLTRQADLVIGLGYDPVEYNYESWLPEVPLVHFDTKINDIKHKGALQVTGSPGEWFEFLALLRSSPEMMSQAEETKKSIRQQLKLSAGGFTPVTVLTVLREMLPADTVVIADVGSHLHLIGQMWDASPPGKLIMTNGWSSMGFGLPAAIAAALTDKKKTVVCVTGDGGLMMHAGEMLTVRRHGLKIIVVVMADGELNLIRLRESWKKVRPYGTDLYEGSLFGSHRFLGTDVIRVTGKATMRSAVSRALISGESTIIEAAIDPVTYDDLIIRS